MTKRLIKWTLNDLVGCVDKMVENEFDCIIFIEGNRGLGKSTLAYKIARRSKLPFNPNRDLVYKRDTVLKQVATKYKGVILADELVNVGYNRDFYEQGQKQLIKAFNMYRDNFNLVIGCIPRFIDLDIQLQGLCKIRITVLRRGVALLQKQISSIYTRDPWDIKNNMKIESKWSTTRTKKPRYIQLSTVFGYMLFGDLRGDQKKIYQDIKREKRHRLMQEDDELSKLQDPETLFYKNLMDRMKKNRLTPTMLQEICMVAGKSYKGTRIYLNRLLKEEGSRKTVKDFIVHNNLIGKIDGLGFTKS